MMRNRSIKQARETAAIAGNLMLAPMVVCMRLPMLAFEAQSADPWRSETVRAITEKTTAIAEGAIAAQLSFIQSACRFWPELLSGQTPSVLDGVAAERVVNAALKPASRQVKANYNRLARKSG